MNHSRFILQEMDEKQLTLFAKKLSKQISLPCVIYLHGDLGAGKTTFTRAFLHALGYQGKVKSPTYTLLETYEFSDFQCVHLDLYRLAHPEEVEHLGLRDLQDQHSLFVIEWPEKAKEELPKADLHCYIRISSAEHRTMEWLSNSEIGKKILARLIKND